MWETAKDIVGFLTGVFGILSTCYGAYKWYRGKSAKPEIVAGHAAATAPTPETGKVPSRSRLSREEAKRQPASANKGKRWGCAVMFFGVLCIFIAFLVLNEYWRYNPKVGKANFDKLEVGMTLQDLQAVLGLGRLAKTGDFNDPDTYGYSFGKEESRKNAWKKAINERRVQIWKEVWGNKYTHIILAAFPGEPSAGTKVDVLYLWDTQELKPAEKWRISKDNFLKLKVGMTLKELEDILGVGERAVHFAENRLETAEESRRKDAWNKAWVKAVKEYRVQRWTNVDKNSFLIDRDHWDKGNPRVLACFSEVPTADTKVEALIFRDGVWDEDKGSISNAGGPAIPAPK